MDSNQGEDQAAAEAARRLVLAIAALRAIKRDDLAAEVRIVLDKLSEAA